MPPNIHRPGLVIFGLFLVGAALLALGIHNRVFDPAHKVALAIEKAAAGHVDVTDVYLPEEQVLISVEGVEPFGGDRDPDWIAYDGALVDACLALRGERKVCALTLLQSSEEQYIAIVVFFADMDCLEQKRNYGACITDYEPMGLAVPPERIRWLGIGT